MSPLIFAEGKTDSAKVIFRPKELYSGVVLLGLQNRQLSPVTTELAKSLAAGLDSQARTREQNQMPNEDQHKGWQNLLFLTFHITYVRKDLIRLSTCTEEEEFMIPESGCWVGIRNRTLSKLKKRK